MDQITSELLYKLKTGDERAINWFVDQFATYIYSICFNVLKTKFDAEEACQDTMMKALSHIDTFSGKSFKAWLYSIAFRTAIDYKRRVKMTLDVNDEIFATPNEHQTDDNLLQDEIKTSISTLLDTLEEDERQIIELYYLDELSIKEVSIITNFSESNVKVKLHRARKTLSLRINQYLEHE